MTRTERLFDPWETIKGAALVTMVGSVIGGIYAYIQSIGKKAAKADVDAQMATQKAEFDKAITTFRVESEKRMEAIERHISQWDQKSDRFVTREVIADLERKMEKMEVRIEASINKLGDRLDKLLEAREK